MPAPLSTAAAFAAHWLGAHTRYSIHSPFVYQFVTQILPHRHAADCARVEAARKAFLHSREAVEILDFGAGYGGKSVPVIRKTLAAVARGSGRTRRAGELLYRMVRAYRPHVCLELGTNLGLSMAYQCLGLENDARFITLEGAPGLAAQATALAERLHLAVQPDVRTGDFAQQLPAVLAQPGLRLDWVFMDGNHREEPTVEYFRQLLPHLNPGACVVLDDIHWSPGMTRAWNTLRALPEVTVDLDLYWMGILFVQRNQAKESFRLRFIP